MNTLLEALSRKAQTPDLRRDAAGGAGNLYKSPLDGECPTPLWLRARAHTIDFRPEELARTHWKKLGRSMLDD